MRVQDLLGLIAHADEKDDHGRMMDMLGWSVDLDSRTITLSDRNRVKTLYGIIQVVVDAPVVVSEIERSASWASRYGLVFSHC